MRNNAHRLAAIFAFVALLVGPIGLAMAQESEVMEELTLTGRLSETEGSYVLVERESGDEIVLSGPKELADHVGHEVRVTGQFAADLDGKEVFAVSSVERAPTE